MFGIACKAGQTTLFRSSSNVHEWNREGVVCSFVSVVLGMRDHPYRIIAFLCSAMMIKDIMFLSHGFTFCFLPP